MIVKEQAAQFIKAGTERRRRPFRKNTARIYQSYIDTWIVPVLGKMELSRVDNPEGKILVQKMTERGLRPATVNGVLNCLKAIVSSATDAKGNEMYPRTWNSDFMDTPVIDGQDSPVIGSQSLLEAISRADGQDKALYGLLAGTGLRIGEALSLSTLPDTGKSFWDADSRVIHVRSTVNHQTQEIQDAPKTAAGIRQVDVHPILNEFLCRHWLWHSGGLLFQKDSRPLVYSTVLRRMHENGIPEAFHAFRRFRLTHLESENVPPTLIKYWAGHAAANVTEKYVKMGQNVEVRRRECERAGLGFEL